MKVDIIGDVHGCFQELNDLLEKLGYQEQNGVPVHPEGRKLSFAGDLTDRGPASLQVIEKTAAIVKSEHGFYSPGNHCDKLYRYFKGNKVQIKHGLETTVAELERLSERERNKIRDTFMNLFEQAPIYQVLDNGKLIVAHAGIQEKDIGRYTNRIREFVLYGDVTGRLMENGLPERGDWALQYKGDPLIVYGHTPVKKPRQMNRTINIDTGAVFGGHLTALRYPEEEIVSVPSSMPFDESRFREFPEI
ncbi:bis(5'-nucleosyl)-tetraphosphatase PrpE [Bacillus sp. FJAT-42376]|uniref:bis(5'-nucleosyl)-tetraphosphatase PrpE n=1 Tax=Bacillus sp. FJAT-42376 TaxID=2014076 RepID=UPI000F4FB6FE|nr:bis(5'-nucleosyl)-tetraphosphatase PrpE [Bacillus sp. FJAT-42376]AZB42386.1 bis(5'-nucleosyl)-tetraphosphatase PrpE [Bacillus sp. FJAT-42376]